MSSLQTWVLAVFAVLATALVVSAYLDRARVRTASDFLLHSESLRLGQLIGTMVATNLSLGNMIFVCAIFGFYYGLGGAFWMAATIISLTVGFLIFAPRLRAYIEARGENFGTVHDFVARSHSPNDKDRERSLRVLAGIVSCVSLFLALIIEVHLAATFAAPVLDLAMDWIVVGLTIGVAAYSMSGGFRSVVFTDVVQALFLMAGIVAGIAFFARLPGGFSPITDAPLDRTVLTGVGPYTAIGLLTLGFAWLLSTPDSWQRNCASRQVETSAKGAAISGIIMTVCVILFSLAGMLVKGGIEPLVSTNPIYSHGQYPLSDIFLLPAQDGLTAFLLSMIAGALLMAAVSTMDTFLVVMAHVLGVDMSPQMRMHRGLPPSGSQELDEEVVFRARTVIFVVGIAVVLGWYGLRSFGFLSDPVNLFFVTYSIQFSLFVPVVASTLTHNKSVGAARLAILTSATITIAVGVPAMIAYASEDPTFLIRPADWLSLLPVLTIGSGAIAYILGIRLIKSRGAP